MLTDFREQADLWSRQLESMVGGLRRLERRGVLWALCSIFAFTLGTTLLSHEWYRELDGADNVSRYLRDVVRAEHQPIRETGEYGTTALLLARSNLVGSRDIPFASIAQSWRDPLDIVARGIEDGEETQYNFDPCGNGALLALDRRSWLKRQYRQFPIAATQGLDALDPANSIDGFTLGPAACLAGLSAEMVAYLPSPVASSHRLTSVATDQYALPVVCDPRRDPQPAPCAVGHAINSMGRNSQLWSYDQRIAQVFFIAADGSLALWSRSGPGNEGMWREPLVQFASAGYFRHIAKRARFVNRGMAVVTPVYIDFIGMGLVRTVCRAVYDESSLYVAVDPALGNRFLGIVCIDIALPIIVNKKELTGLSVGLPGDPITDAVELDNPLFEISVYCESAGKIFEYSSGDNSCSAGKKPAELELDEKHLIARVLRSPFSRGGDVDEPVFEPLSRRGAAAVNLRLLPGSQEHIVALLRPSPIRLASMPIAFGFLAMFLALLFALLASRRGQVERSRLTTLELLRSIPMGVAMIDKHQKIVFGNDRAEELLGVPLPTDWHDSENIADQRFDRFIRKARQGVHQKVVVLPWGADGRLNSETAVRGAGDRSPYDTTDFYREEAPKLRGRGRPYAYVAWLRPGGDSALGRNSEDIQVLVRGTPVLHNAKVSVLPFRDRSDDWFALGVFDEVLTGNFLGRPDEQQKHPQPAASASERTRKKK